LTTPLSNLLKKKYFKWDNNVEECFETLKMIISSTLVLATPYFTKIFLVECDALRFVIGAMLMQYGHPISFESRNIKKGEGLNSTYNK
jgi:hypothetical protein